MMTEWSALLLYLLLAISIVDWRTERIPDALNIALVVSGLGFGMVASPADLQTHIIGAVAGFVPLALFGEAFFRLRGTEGLGLGDAKMFAGTGAWLGWQDLPIVLLVASLGGILIALVFFRRDGTAARIPFGPFIALGTIAVWFVP